MTDPKTISRATYLQALGLFTMAYRHREKADEFSKELRDLLQTDNDFGHLSDAIYGERGTFDEALQREGFVVEKET